MLPMHSVLLDTFHDRMSLYSTSSEKPPIFFDRATGSVSIAENRVATQKPLSQEKLVGFMGVIRLLAGPYILGITSSSTVGYIFGNPVYSITGVKPICIQNNFASLTKSQEEDEKKYINLLRQQLETAGLYYSPTFDLTTTVQKQAQEHNLFSHKTLGPSSFSDQFFWNKNLVCDFLRDEDLKAWITPVICGFIGIERCIINDQHFDFILISRRNRHRAGVRYNCRGIDSKGNVANFVETEQIISTSNKAWAYIQIRGSMPVLWTQTPNIRYSPPVVLGDEAQSLDCFRLHAQDIQNRYGSQTYVNLVNKRGTEHRIASAFQRHVEQSPDFKISYIHFDFNQECQKLKFERVNILLDSVRRSIASHGYFYANDGTVESTQTGVLRTNCIDCLDRTNLVQTVFSRFLTTKAFQCLNILKEDTFENYQRFDSTFKSVWADNADMISLQYSGTPALKTDFTRTGKRRLGGMYNDFKHSIKRYFLNNFMDGQRQDSFDLIHGNFQIDSESYSSPFNRSNPLKWVLVLGLIYAASVTLTFFPPGFTMSAMGYFLGTQALLWFSIYHIIGIFHPYFVDRPNLSRQPRFIGKRD